MPRPKTPEAKARQVAAVRGPRNKGTIDIDLFCLKFLECRSQIRPTKRALRIGVDTIYRFLRDPEIDRHMEAARKLLVDKAAIVSAKRVVLDRSHLDERLLRGLDKHRTHKTRGDMDYYGGIEIGYKSLQLIEAPKVINSATAGAQAGQTAFEVYEPQWLRDKKADWDRQLADKHGLVEHVSQG